MNKKPKNTAIATLFPHLLPDTHKGLSPMNLDRKEVNGPCFSLFPSLS